MDYLATGLFLMSAIALLGSPGPAIAALLAVGRAEGMGRGMKYYGGLQVGLAAAAGISGAGLFSLLELMPAALMVMSIGAALYLIYLSYQIATAPIGPDQTKTRSSSSPLAGLFLGLSNPKAYVAFISLYASHALIAGDQQLDSTLKWALCVIVMIVVDLGWLLVGVGLGKARLSPPAERALNVCLGLMVLVATILAFV